MIRNVLLFLFLLGNTCAAQTVLIGTIPYAPENRIRIMRAADHISGKKELLASALTDSLGRFTVTVANQRSEYLEIVSEYHRAGLYVTPGLSYKFSFLPADSGEVVTLGRKIPVALKIESPSYDSVNTGIEEVNAVLDSFFISNQNLFLLKAAKPVVDKFKPVLARRFSGYHPLVRTYLKYAFAPIDEAVFRDRRSLYQEYFSGPVLYDNKDYMDYFNQFFIRYLQVQTVGKCEQEYNTAINKNRSLNDLLEALKKCDTLVKNDTLRELILLKGLKELYDLPKQNKQNITMILDKTARVNKGLTGRIASNILDELTYLKEGTKASFENFTDLEGKPVDLAKLKGKHVYLFFWASWCDPCLQEIKALHAIKDKYQRKVAFIGVNIDRDKDDAQNAIKRYKLDWLNVSDAEGQIAYTYRVKAIPRVFMIDPDGDLLAAPPLPGENLKGYLEELTRKK